MSYSIIFTIKNRCGIILIVKKLATFTTAALLAVSLMGGGASANAADGGTIYPEDEKFIKVLAFDSLGDYAVDGEKYAFADGNTVKILKDGEYIKTPPFDKEVISLDIKDSVIYCSCSDGTSYSLTEKLNENNKKFYESQKCEYVFGQKSNRILFGDYLYNIHNGNLYINYLEAPELPPEIYEGNFSNLKQYGENVYAVNGNVLYEFTGTQGNAVVLEYTIDTKDLHIAVGQASVALKSFAPVQFVEIAEGAIMTKVDLENLSDEFIATDIVKAKENTTALLLCYTGNAAVVSIGESSYILLKSKTSETEMEYSTEKPFETAQMTNNMIYASPFVTGGTACYNSAMSMVVTVLARLECTDVLDTPFYEVEYEVAGMKARGYVTEGFLTPYIAEDNKKPEEVRDPEYSENSDTKTILIIFAVVVLVLAVLAYVVHLSSNKKNKKNKKKDKNKEE